MERDLDTCIMDSLSTSYSADSFEDEEFTASADPKLLAEIRGIINQLADNQKYVQVFKIKILTKKLIYNS